MPTNSYLVIGMLPASNEMGVALTVTLTVSFQKNMVASSLNASTLKFRKVNGALVPSKITYDNVNKRVYIQPDAPLEPATQYQMEIVGGPSGVLSILDEYLPSSKNYSFYTKEEDIAVPLKNLQVAEKDGLVSITWDAIDVMGSYQYQVKLSHSNLPDNTGIWPESGAYETSGISIDVPKKLQAGTYYAHARSKKNTMFSEWRTASVSIQESTGGGTENNGGSEGTGSGLTPSVALHLTVLETYPKDGAFHVTPDKIGVLFSEPLDLTKYDDWFRVEEIVGTETSSFMSLGATVVSGSVVEVEAGLTESNVLTFLPTIPLQKDKTYQFILKQGTQTKASEPETMNVEGTIVVIDGQPKTLEKEFRSTFQSAFTYYYVTVDEVKTELRYFGQFIDDNTLAKLIVSNSRAAYQMASVLKDFDPNLFLDGASPFYMHEYVKYKTSFDIALTTMVELSMGTDKTIRLADLSVAETGRQSFVLQSLINELRAKIKPWEDLMHGRTARGYASMGTAVYSEEGNPYPDFFEGRTEFPELGS